MSNLPKFKVGDKVILKTDGSHWVPEINNATLEIKEFSLGPFKDTATCTVKILTSPNNHTVSGLGVGKVIRITYSENSGTKCPLSLIGPRPKLTIKELLDV